MYFRFNQDKKSLSRNYFFAWLSMTVNALAIAVICYGLSAIILLLILNLEINILSIRYISIFLIIFVVALLTFSIVFVRTQKGIIVEENSIVINSGYFIKYQPVHNRINISDISSVRYVDNYKAWKERHKQNKKGFFAVSVWEAGTNAPLVEICDSVSNIVYLVPCERPEEFVEILSNKMHNK
ncbi:MAG: hypothetical protein Q3968_07010 [Clostridiaceae bacterium]|nr:hypothetical protein [Clostridiaceae bacterium]